MTNVSGKLARNKELIKMLISIVGFVLTLIGVVFSDELGKQLSNAAISVGTAIASTLILFHIIPRYLLKKS